MLIRASKGVAVPRLLIGVQRHHFIGGKDICHARTTGMTMVWWVTTGIAGTHASSQV